MQVIKHSHICPQYAWKCSSIQKIFFLEESTFIYLFLFIYFWLQWIFTAVRGLLSSCGAWVLSPLVVARGLQACGLCSLWHTGCLVEVRGLSCPSACGILVPWPGIEPASPELKGGFFTTGPPGKCGGPNAGWKRISRHKAECKEDRIY